MNSGSEVYLPCEVIGIKVRLGPNEALSPIESIFLRFVHAGVHEFGQLAALLEIGNRPVLDLVFDLWQRGYLVLDLARGRVMLSEDLNRFVEEDRLQELRGAEAADETCDVMLERLTGHCMKVSGQKNPPVDSQRIVPIPQIGIERQDVSKSELIEIVRQIFEGENLSPAAASGRSRKVLDAKLGLPFLREVRELRWLPLDVDCTIHPDSGRLAVEVLDSGILTASARRDIGERLSLLAEEAPDAPFFDHLLRQARRETRQEEVGFDETFSHLQGRIDRLTDLAPGLESAHHGQLSEVADEAESALQQRLDSQIGFRAFKRDTHLELALELIRDARRQLVLVSPFIALQGMEPFLKPLEEALRRGVQVFVLWGISLHDKLPRDAGEALRDLAGRYPSRFFYSTRSSLTHAKTLICDQRCALITSMNLLAPSGAGTAELGIRLASPSPHRPSTVLFELLQWSCRTFPDFRVKSAMLRTKEDFLVGEAPYSNGSLSPHAPAPEPALNLGRPAPPASSVENDELARARTEFWRRSWLEYSSSLRRCAQAAAVSGRIRVNAQHRDLLWKSLRTAGHRLLLASDQLGPEVVDASFVDCLRQRLEQGVFVAIIYRRPSRHAGIAAFNPVEALESLTSFPNMRFIRSDSHAKLLVFDDTAVVSSFNFLSFEGAYEEQRGLQRLQRSELGLQIFGIDAVESVVETFRSSFKGDLMDFPGPAAENSGPLAVADEEQGSAAEGRDLLERLGSSGDDRERASALRTAFSNSDHAWQMLDQLRLGGLRGKALELAVACCLDSRPHQEAPAERRRWTLWMAREAWKEGSRLEAAVLLASQSQALNETGLPPPWLALLSAAQERPETADAALSEASARSDLSSSDRFALAAAALAQMLLHGSHQAAEVLEAHLSALPDAWAGFAREAEEFWRQTYQPMPLARIRSDLRSARRSDALDHAWKDLEDVLQRESAKQFKFESGLKTWEYLFHEAGPFGRLRASVQARQEEQLQHWLEVEGVDSLEDFLDEASRRATGRNQLIEREQRPRALKALQGIVDAARQAMQLAKSVGGGYEDWTIEPARSLAESLKAAWPDLQAELDKASGDAQRPIAEGALSCLVPIKDWPSTWN